MKKQWILLGIGGILIGTVIHLYNKMMKELGDIKFGNMTVENL